jgi:hypothetical protein
MIFVWLGKFDECVFGWRLVPKNINDRESTGIFLFDPTLAHGSKQY